MNSSHISTAWPERGSRLGLRGLIDSALSFEAVFAAFLLSGTYKATSIGQALHVDATLLTGCLTVVVGVVLVVRSGGFPRVAVPALLSGFLVIAWLGATVAWSSGSDQVLADTLRGLVLVGVAFAGAVCVVATDERRVVRFLHIFAAFGVVLVMITFNIIPATDGLSATAASSRIARGVAMAVGAQVLLVVGLSPEYRGWMRVGALFLSVIYLAGVLFAGTRQALIGIILSFPILMPMGLRAARRSKAMAFAFGGVLIVIAVSAGPRVVRSLQTINRLEIFLSGRLGNSGDIRVARLRSAIDGFEAAPLLGNGVGSFGHVWGGNPMDYPHNAVAEVMFDGGVVGLLLFTFLCAFTVFRFTLEVPWLAGLCRYALPCTLISIGFSALVSNTITDNRLTWGFLGLCTIHALARSAGPAENPGGIANSVSYSAISRAHPEVG
ncbi:MAG: O-antigen ligase family protein [Gemmatimonadales bacterium]